MIIIIKNNNLLENSSSKKAKIATVRLIYKKKDFDEIENYRPVSILSCFSKVYEKFLLGNFKPFIITCRNLLQHIRRIIAEIIYKSNYWAY